MSGQFHDIAYNIRDAAFVVEIVVVPVVLTLLTLDILRRRRKQEKPTARRFELQPVVAER